MDERHDDLVAALRELGDALLVPDGGTGTGTRTGDVAGAEPRGPDDLVAGAVRRIVAGPGAPPAPRVRLHRRRRPRSLRRMVAAAAAMALVAGAVLVAPGPRAAVARFLGIGGVRVVTSGEVPAGIGRAYDLGEAIPVEQALALAPAPLVPDGVGAPAAAFAGRPEGGVTLVWAATDALPAIGGAVTVTDAAGLWRPGLIVTAFPATPEPVITKEIGPGSQVQAMTVGGRPGYWIAGAPHEMRVGSLPGGSSESVRLAGDTLLWTDGVTTYRLESALGREGAVAVAEGIAAGGG